MRTITIKNKKYPIHINTIALMNFGKKLGYSNFSQVQAELATFEKLQTEISFEALEKISKLIFCAIEEGCEVQQVEVDITEKIVLRQLTENPDELMKAFESLSDLGEGKGAPKKAPQKAPKKK